MKLKKILKKLISVSVAGTLLTSVLPANFAFANMQRHIMNLTIASVPTTDNNYRISLNWNNPNSWSTNADNNAYGDDKTEIHPPEGYIVEGLNATANETAYLEYDNVQGSNILTDIITPTNPLNSGSIYEFQVLPYHYHFYEIDNNMRIEDKAPYESGNPEKVLFMTDIEVSATGSGNTLTVNWDNPQYRGRDIFTGYRIYYQRGGDKVSTFNTYKDVSILDEGIRKQSDDNRKGVQVFSYDVYDSNLIQGEYYAVKVEPLYNGAPLRDLTATGQSFKNIVVNDVNYKISFRYMEDKEYRTNEASIAIPLEVYEDGKDFLKLHWWGISNTIGTIDRIEVYDGDSATDIGNKIGTIFSPQALYVNTWQVDKPSAVKYYRLLVYVDGKTTPVESAIAYFDPSIVNITPNVPDIYASVNSAGSPSIDVYWDAFVRYPYNENEEAFVREDGTFIDTNVVYDMWITDSLDSIKDVNLGIKALARVPASSLTLTENENLDLPCYVTNLTQYVTTDESGGYITKSIEKNKTYYIKLVAIKPCSDLTDKAAEPVYISVYVPTDENISTPQSLNKPPLRIKRDTDGKKVITQNSITVEWNSKWLEVYDSETDDWYSIVALRNSQIIYGVENIDEDNDTLVNLYRAKDRDEALELFIAAGLSEDAAASLEIREIDLSDESISYELKYLPFDDINSDGGYLTYLETLLNSEDQNWTQIDPTTNTAGYLEHTVSPLEKNKAYVIILRPYRTLSDGTKEAYPTYVIGTTLPDEVVINVQPTVPVLEEVEHDDVSFEVKWEEYSSSLDYELAVNETIIDDPVNAAIFFGSDAIIEDGVENVENERMYMHFIVDKLFPKTGYYVWLRAIAHNEEGDVYSQWSNPIFIETDDLLPPNPPDGLGPASSENLKIYNNANSTNYIPTDYNYIIVEWLKIYEDKGYTAVANPEGDGYTVLDHEDFKNNFMVKFNDLDPNKAYYFRVKTRVTVSMGEDGSVKEYAYIIQMADNDDFEEAIELIVPVDRGSEGNTAEKFYVAESEWGEVVKIYSEPSDGEYNGNENPDFYPLPDEDFELIYDYPTKSLTYRFRSDKEDEDGMDDNLVDQRFISRLIANKVFTLPIDLTSYLGGEIRQRIVEIPYTVMSAFDERKISLKITANNATFTFKPGFLDTAQFNNINNFGLGSTVKIIVTERPSDSPVLNSNQGYLSAPQNVSVTVYTNSNITVLDSAGENIDISMKLANRYSAVDSNVGLFYDTKTTNAWNRLDYVYDNATGTYNTESARLGTYSVIATASPVAAGAINSEANSTIGSIASKINITDLVSYNPQKAVSVIQFNNLVAAVAAGKKDAELNGALSTDDYTSLSRKGIILTGSVVSREQAVNALVTLYETKTGRRITYYTPLDSSSYSAEIGTASAGYQPALLKAADLGFFETSNGVRPKDVMSLNELFYITNIILEDSNY